MYPSSIAELQTNQKTVLKYGADQLEAGDSTFRNRKAALREAIRTGKRNPTVMGAGLALECPLPERLVMNRTGIIVIAGMLTLGIGCAAQTTSNESSSQATSPTETHASAPVHKNAPGRWYVKVGEAAALYHSKADVKAMGSTVSGGSAKVTNQPLELVDVGYMITPNIGLNLMAGVPAKPKLTATGTLAAYGTLGHVMYGPAILSAQYHVRRFGALQPYVGGGAVYAIIFKDYDATIQNLSVKSHWGSAAMIGTDYMFNKKWGMYVEGEQLWLAVNAKGNILGAVPATAHVQLNPSKVAVGVKYNF